MQTPAAARWDSSGRNFPARQDVSGGHFHARTTYGHVRNSPEASTPGGLPPSDNPHRRAGQGIQPARNPRSGVESEKERGLQGKDAEPPA